MGFYGFPVSFCGFSYGFLFFSVGYSHRNPVGIGWEWVLKFYSHGNPGYMSTVF